MSIEEKVERVSKVDLQESKAKNYQFRTQIIITILAAVLTPLITILGVKYQLSQEQENWSTQRDVIKFEKLHEQKIKSFQRLNLLLAEYRRAYKNKMYAEYFGSIAPNISKKQLELAHILKEQKEELELSAVELSKGELWKYSIENMTKASGEYNEAFDNLRIHIQSSVFFFSANSQENMKQFADYINSSFRITWPKPNHDELLRLVGDGKHPWEALDVITENDFKEFSNSKLNELQTEMIEGMVGEIYLGRDFDASN